MSAATDFPGPLAAGKAVKPHLDHSIDVRLVLGLMAVLAGGLFYMAYSIRSDLSAAADRRRSCPSCCSALRC